jgi:hypothetical protein
MAGWRTVLHKNTDRYYLMASSDAGSVPAAGATFSSGNLNVYAPAPIPAGVWTHLAATFDGVAIRLYVNGAQVAAVAQTSPMTTSTGSLQIGRSVYGEFFSGLIDELRIYNQARTAAQIQADMQTPVGAP